MRHTSNNGKKLMNFDKQYKTHVMYMDIYYIIRRLVTNNLAQQKIFKTMIDTEWFNIKNLAFTRPIFKMNIVKIYLKKNKNC